MNLCDYKTIQALLLRHGFHFSKSMGQNFLIDPSVSRSIAEASGADMTCGVLEIGPGVGPLTVELAKRAGRVIAVELDRALLPILEETLSGYSNTKVISADILKLNLPSLIAEELAGLTPIVCANLPYNITSPMLALIAETSALHSATVMIQREVAQRICAPQGSGGGSAFSLFLQYHMHVEFLFDVSPSSFYPMPKVTSSVIHCIRREHPAVSVNDEAFFFRVIRGAFVLRRKTLVNSLSSSLKEYEKAEIQRAVNNCGLPEAIRGEKLTLQNFADLCTELNSLH